MSRKTGWVLIAVAAVVFLCALGVGFSRTGRFVAGGALINLGFRLQDHLEEFDLSERHKLTPEDAYEQVLRQNRLAASVRDFFPRSERHPVVAMVVCMDARIDTAELVGDTRKYYYVIRTAGSAVSEIEQEMLELAVANGVRTILLTTHTQCAAEAVARDPARRQQYPALARAVDERAHQAELLKLRPSIAAKLKSGALVIKHVRIDTHTDRILELPPP